MSAATSVPRALAVAAGSGDAAADALRRIAVGNRDPTKDIGVWPFQLSSRFRWVLGSGVDVHQIEGTCRLLDDFAATIEDLNKTLSGHGVQISWSQDASHRLWRSSKAAAPILNDLNVVLGRLERIRINVILKRPLET